jgi:co-chaperonin GroES (HSP10)
MDWKPMGRRVIVRPEVKKASSVLVTMGEEEPVTGVVVVGGCGLKTGDRVFFRPYMGAVLEEEYRILHEEDILAWASS